MISQENFLKRKFPEKEILGMWMTSGKRVEKGLKRGEG